MKFQDEAPPLNPWPFLVGDAALLATAYLIGNQANAPLNGLPLLAAVACVGLGAVLAVIPFLVNHTRRQELALADRQREIAALAQTTATSAEQISIAAASLHSLAESSARTAKLAEHIPHKMQERINDFKAQLNEVAVTENEALAQEINTLRASETERLETALSGVRKTAADLAMIEAVSRKHLAELNEGLARFSAAAVKAATDSTANIAAARAAAEKSVAEAHSSAATALQTTIADALDQIDRRFAALPGRLSSANKDEPTETSRPTTKTASPLVTVKQSTPPFPPIVPEIAPAAVPSLLDEEPPVISALSDPPETVPVLFAEDKPVRKRATRKTTPPIETELIPGIDASADNFSQIAPDDGAPAVSADGLTRLLVTAYIGIGNKLFVRGDGPGLSWESGVPLQFVSIGKWRWETPDASAPFSLKLYKNDEIECQALGTIALQPGRQQEVTASFN